MEYKGTKPKSGTVIINSDGEVAIAIHNGIYCATKGYHNSEITVTKKTLEECSYGPVTFGRIFGGINNDTFNKVIAVSDGFIAVGLSDSFDRDLAGANKGNYDAVIVKYDLNGNVAIATAGYLSDTTTAVIGIKTYHLGAYQYSAYEQKINSNTTLLFK